MARLGRRERAAIRAKKLDQRHALVETNLSTPYQAPEKVLVCDKWGNARMVARLDSTRKVRGLRFQPNKSSPDKPNAVQKKHAKLMAEFKRARHVPMDDKAREQACSDREFMNPSSAGPSMRQGTTDPEVVNRWFNKTHKV